MLYLLRTIIPLLFFASLSLGCADHAQQESVSLEEFSSAIVGKQVRYFQEQGQPLGLEQAQQKFRLGHGKPSNSESLTLGIGTAPAWLHFSVDNPFSEPQQMRLAINTPWLDIIDSWLVFENTTLVHIQGGDAFAFAERPMPHENFAFLADFPPGTTDVYLRVETHGPMAIPVELSTAQAAITQDIGKAYRYGVLYGMLVALALYNLVLYLLTRQREFGLYSLYLLGFVINSLSYTGQLHELITYDFGRYFQDWLDCFLMITYSVAGLHFARVLLRTKQHAPALDRLVCWVTIVIPLGIVIGALGQALVFSLLLAFVLNSSFALLFIVMGLAAHRAGNPAAPLFIVASVTAATCIGVSTMAVAGLLPYNAYTFQAIEVGMVFEAIMLAVLLANRFRSAKQELAIAEKVAQTDPLTNINNRRGFEAQASSYFEQALREQQDIAVLLIDIDHFKRVNDRHGHSVGDLVLQHTADTLSASVRRSDLIARWGGEEFIMLLNNTSQQDAKVFAERLRKQLAEPLFLAGRLQIDFTISVGVAGSNQQLCGRKAVRNLSLDHMINCADSALYRAKNSGRNQVMDLCGECEFSQAPT